MLDIPAGLIRNHPSITKDGTTKTGKVILKTVLGWLNLEDYSSTSVLDVGCGTRLTQTIINNSLTIKSYTGIDIDLNMINYLKANVADPRFHFIHLDIKNELYNTAGDDFSKFTRFPTNDSFDIIWLFSVFTHLKEEDSQHMLKILRKHIRTNGRLVFTTFLDTTIKKPIVDMNPDKPLQRVHYRPEKMTELVLSNGWWIIDIYPPQNYMANVIVCRPI